MLFNTLTFFIFLVVTYLLYISVFGKEVKTRNMYLLAISYVFYGWWDWRFLFLIVTSSAISYYCGNTIGNSLARGDQKSAKRALVANVSINLLILCVFKYLNFLTESFVTMLGAIGLKADVPTLNIILPVGISFFTFQALSYTIDIYRGKSEPAKDAVSFFTYIAFFPQLVAGPIERASNMLPQFMKKYQFDYSNSREGVMMIVIGLFKKMVIADRLSIYVDNVWGNLENAQSLSLLLGLIFFTFQLYLDFSAYSQIAIGTAKLFGFDLMRNFDKPYLATTFKEFWSKWHISLTSWFRDYLYISLGGNRKGKTRTYVNNIIVFAVSGLWHGASWNFAIWGTLNGLYLVIEKMTGYAPTQKATKALSALFVTGMWMLSLAFFRSQTFADALYVLGNIGTGGMSDILNHGMGLHELIFTISTIAVLMIAEFVTRKGDKNIDNLLSNKIAKWAFYILLPLSIILLGVYGNGNDSSFIYFQF